MANNLMQMILDVPPMLIAAWLAWFLAGGVLAMWYRRASLEAEFAPVSAPRAAVRPKPATKPWTGFSTTPVSEEPVMAQSPVIDEPAAPAAARAPRGTSPVSVGDPYGDLATLLDQPSTAVPAQPRVPSDSPILNSSGAPMLRNDRS